MKVVIDGDKIVLDDKLSIEEVNGQYAFNGPLTFGIGPTTVPNLEAKPDDELTLDPYNYQSYDSNGYTVFNSAVKAASRVENDFDNYGTVESDYDDIHEACVILIRDKKGRHSCYAIAGNVVKYAKEGYYKGLPLSFVFRGLVEGRINFHTENERNNSSSDSLWLR